MASVSGNLITRNYSNFLGVDFSNRKDEISLRRSPDALNVWKNYKSTYGKGIETRPGLDLVDTFTDKIYGIFEYEINTHKHIIVHAGTKLYDVYNNTKTQIATGLNPAMSKSFIYNNIFFFKDGLNYKEYDGATCSDVTGYVPRTSISRNPMGGGTQLEDVNLLSDYRINEFVADGTSTRYYLDTAGIDNDYTLEVWVDGTKKTYQTDYTVNFTGDALGAYVDFVTAPSEPLTTGQDNVKIQYKKTISGYKNRILRCNLLEVFDNRVFFSGNIDYPSTIFHSSLNNPRYVSDTDYYTEGMDASRVKALVTGNNALWVIKEPSQANTTIYYHTPAIDSELGKTYPSNHSSISTGCVSTGINFRDDIVFFSEMGLEGISGDITTEQVVAHRSSLVDSKLVNETHYKNMIVLEWEGYLLVVIDNKIYLADSRAKTQINDHIEYEWYYWEMEENITYANVVNGTLYLCSNNKMYDLVEKDIEAYWTTLEDEFGYPHYRKITNKKGCVVDLEGNITIYAKQDRNKFVKINEYKNKKGYVVPKIKMKKWKSIQLKFYSKKRFQLFSSTLEAYVGSYVKR